MKVLPSISPTGLASFSTCRQQWYWSYPQGYKPIARQAALELGDGVHQALAAMYKGQMQDEEVDPVRFFTKWADAKIAALADDKLADVADLAKMRTMGIAMLEQYMARWTNDQFEILAVERTVTRKLPGTDWRIKTIIDTVIRDHADAGKVWVLEHKTFSRFDESYLEKDHQFVAEAWNARFLVAKLFPDEQLVIEGTIWNGLRKQIEGPRVKNPLVERRRLPINDTQIAMFHKRARHMHDVLTAGKVAIFPEPSSMACSYCSFKQVCSEYQRGGDFQFLLDTSFTKRVDEEEGDDED